MDKKELVEFLEDNLSIRINEGEFCKQLTVDLVLTVDGEEIVISNDSVTLTDS